MAATAWSRVRICQQASRSQKYVTSVGWSAGPGSGGGSRRDGCWQPVRPSSAAAMRAMSVRRSIGSPPSVAEAVERSAQLPQTGPPAVLIAHRDPVVPAATPNRRRVLAAPSHLVPVLAGVVVTPRHRVLLSGGPTAAPSRAGGRWRVRRRGVVGAPAGDR